MECYQKEIEGKRINDPLNHLFNCDQKRRQQPSNYSDCEANDRATATATATAIAAAVHKQSPCIRVCGPIIVGAGPSGLAVAACLKEKGVPSMVIERSNCIASLWQHKSYERLRLHLPKRFCELPLMPFPACFPQYPTKQQFVAYLDEYAARFDIRPTFDQTVVAAEFDSGIRSWRVTAAVGRDGAKDEAIEYVSRWLVVATGENAEEVTPVIDGVREFEGRCIHTSSYTSGHAFQGRRVLVVGCGNSGMEVCLDLCNHNARPSIVVRDAVHILPREILGWSTFGLFMWLLKWLSVPTVDRFLLLVSRTMLGDIQRYGLRRPELGPLQHKSLSGKTPVLDVGTLAKIKSGDIKVRPAIKRLTSNGAEFVDGRLEAFDAVIFATGYKSNVPTWLKEKEFFSERDGLPRKHFPNSWKGESGLYAAGFTRRGLMGTSMDAVRIAHDIEQEWKKEKKTIKR